MSIYQHIIDPSRPINKQNDVAYIPDYGVELPEPPIVTDSGAVLYEGRWGAQTTAANGAQPSSDVMVNGKVPDNSSQALRLPTQSESNRIGDNHMNFNQSFTDFYFYNPCCYTVPLIKSLNAALKNSGVIGPGKELNYKKIMGCMGMQGVRSGDDPVPGGGQISSSATSLYDATTTPNKSFVSNGSFRRATTNSTTDSSVSALSHNVSIYSSLTSNDGPLDQKGMTKACQNVPDSYFGGLSGTECVGIPVIKNDDRCAQALLLGTFGDGAGDCDCLQEVGARIKPNYFPPGKDWKIKNNLAYITDMIKKGLPVPMQTNSNSEAMTLFVHFMKEISNYKVYAADPDTQTVNRTDILLKDILESRFGMGLDFMQELYDDINGQKNLTGPKIDISKYINNKKFIDILKREMMADPDTEFLDPRPIKLPGHHYTVEGYEYDADTGKYRLLLDMGFGWPNNSHNSMWIEIDPNDPNSYNNEALSLRVNGPVSFSVESCKFTGDTGQPCKDSESTCELLCSKCVEEECKTVSIDLLKDPNPNMYCTDREGLYGPEKCTEEPDFCYGQSQLQSLIP